MQTKGSKRQNMAEKWKNMAQNIFPNEYLLDIKTKMKT